MIKDGTVFPLHVYIISKTIIDLQCIMGLYLDKPIVS